MELARDKAAERCGQPSAGGRALLVLPVLCFALFLVAFCGFLSYASNNDNTYVRVQMHEANTADRVDIVFLGSSMAYRGFDPEVWDANLDGMVSLNLGTSNQTPMDSYYIMKQLLQRHRPRYCIYACRYGSFSSDIRMQSNVIFDNLSGVVKLQYGLSAFDGRGLIEAFLPFLRARPLSFERMRDVLQTKSSEEYQSYGYHVYNTDAEEYRGRGFVFTNRATQEGHVGYIEPYSFGIDDASGSQLEYFSDLAELCRENGCELILMIPPCPRAALTAADDYQSVADFYTYLGDANDIAVFDFTLAREELLGFSDASFYDASHMSGTAAEAFSDASSRLFSRYLSGDVTSSDALFYSNYGDLLAAESYVYNAWIEQSDGFYSARYASGRDVTVEYRFSFVPDGTDSEVILQDFCDNPQLAADGIPEEPGLLVLTVRGHASGVESLQTDALPVGSE